MWEHKEVGTNIDGSTKSFVVSSPAGFQTSEVIQEAANHGFLQLLGHKLTHELCVLHTVL